MTAVSASAVLDAGLRLCPWLYRLAMVRMEEAQARWLQQGRPAAPLCLRARRQCQSVGRSSTSARHKVDARGTSSSASRPLRQYDDERPWLMTTTMTRHYLAELRIYFPFVPYAPVYAPSHHISLSVHSPCLDRHPLPIHRAPVSASAPSSLAAAELFHRQRRRRQLPLQLAYCLQSEKINAT